MVASRSWMDRGLRWIVTGALGVVALVGCGGGGGDGGSGPGTNRAPVIQNEATALLSAYTLHKPGDVVEFDLRVLDPDIEPVTFAWTLEPSTGVGSFDDPTANDPKWTVGAYRGTVTVRCVVSDGELEVVYSRAIEVGSEISARTITSAQTWTAAQSPYVVTGQVTVGATGSLTIEPGVVLHMRPQRTLVGGTFNYTFYSIRVAGSLTAGSVGAAEMAMVGGLRADVRPDQHDGFVFQSSGQGQIVSARIEQARTAVTNSGSGSVEISGALLKDNSENGVLSVGQVGSQTLIEDSILRRNANGVAVNSGGVTIERCIFDDNTVALAAGGSVTATDCTFNGSGEAHLKINASITGPVITVAVHGSDFENVDEGGYAVSITEISCAKLDLQIRGNCWGPSISTPADILARFERGDGCNSGISGWTDSDCGDGDCDWGGCD